MYAYSTDCGESFSTPVALGDFVWDENATEFAIIDRDNPASGLGVAAETGNPHVVWTSFENGQSTAYYARSTDAGATWEAPVNFNDLLPESNTQAYFLGRIFLTSRRYRQLRPHFPNIISATQTILTDRLVCFLAIILVQRELSVNPILYGQTGAKIMVRKST